MIVKLVAFFCGSLAISSVMASSHGAAPKRGGKHPSQPSVVNLSKALAGLDIAVALQDTRMSTMNEPLPDSLRPIRKGAVLVLVSRTTSYGLANVIDYSSGRQGWVPFQTIKIRYTQHHNPLADLQSASALGESTPTISITNDLRVPLYLHLDGMPEVTIESHATKKVEVSPGIRNFNASGPSLTPKFGTKAIANGEAYSWRWWIVTGHQPAHFIDPVSAASFRQKQMIIKSMEQDLSRLELDFGHFQVA